MPEDFLRLRRGACCPWSMNFDKITPHPSQRPPTSDRAGRGGHDHHQERHRHAPSAPFVNAEVTEYLVLEDHFPNGRPPLDRWCPPDSATVEKSERMKVGPVEPPTALAVFGCLLDYRTIAAEMRDTDLVTLVETYRW